MSEFYDENFRRVQGRNPLIANVIEHCYELCLGYSQYETEKEEMMQHLETLTAKVEELERKVRVLRAEKQCSASSKT